MQHCLHAWVQSKAKVKNGFLMRRMTCASPISWRTRIQYLGCRIFTQKLLFRESVSRFYQMTRGVHKEMCSFFSGFIFKINAVLMYPGRPLSISTAFTTKTAAPLHAKNCRINKGGYPLCHQNSMVLAVGGLLFP